MLSGIIADIQRTSVHDGPGLRTTVFFKGCPLNCIWCHNPECIKSEPETMFYPEKCIGCKMCDKGCYTGAKVICGKKMTSQEVFSEIMLDYDYYQTDGGVTFSGGEPMQQKDFLNELIDMCRQKGINTAIETSLIIYDENVFKKLDCIMADLKIWDSDIHKKYTGVNNEIIKENFKKINTLNIPIIARTPYIPDINQQIDKISEFLKTLDNVKKYEILPYHQLGVSKQIALGHKQTRFTVPSKEQIKEANKYAYIR